MIVQDAVRLVARTLHPRWLQRPTILPDELAHSYALRVLVLNEANSLDSLVAAVSAAGLVDPKVPKAEFLAWIADVDISEFLQFHTLLPFQQAFTCGATPHSHGENRDNHLRYEALRVKVASFRVCDACKQEDLAYWGFPFIRVSHHIPGVEWCEKHAQPLISTGFDTRHISRIQRFSWTAAPSDSTECPGPQNEVLERYAAVSTALMARCESMPMRQASRIIAARAKQQGLRRALWGSRKILSDLVLETVPKDWIARLLPSFFSQKTMSGVFAASMDGVMKRGIICRPEAYALALAVLYDDADEALSDLTNAQEAPESLKVCTKRSRPIGSKPAGAYTATEVAEAYVRSNFSNAAMAKLLGGSCTWTRLLLLRLNLPPASLIGKARNRAALLSFKAGANIESACTSAGASVTDLVDLLRFDLDLLVPLIRRS